ncbi:hypothetical protein RFI_14534 [Reticulomyxa filosa]|uniref:Uncharacterized protein n=1 Tax=Reticulomyxa filosa TaxID=46433 RepID=X6NA67_RETFI|nr:hypothetical protein RFI_14534 [Reticulomyxa filosa]|eukprot:ETO22659.1 hypothetical protein RFI_14534 [Reticulomyxa filosa]
MGYHSNHVILNNFVVDYYFVKLLHLRNCKKMLFRKNQYSEGMASGGNEPLSQIDSDLIEACKNNNPEEVRKALKKGANVGVQFRQTLEEVTPLILASTKGYAEIVEVLLEFDPEVNAKTSFGHATALLQAVSNEHIDCVKLLLQKGAHVNQGDKLGRTPLMDAAENGS